MLCHIGIRYVSLPHTCISATPLLTSSKPVREGESWLTRSKSQSLVTESLGVYWKQIPHREGIHNTMNPGRQESLGRLAAAWHDLYAILSGEIKAHNAYIKIALT